MTNSEPVDDATTNPPGTITRWDVTGNIADPFDMALQFTTTGGDILDIALKPAFTTQLRTALEQVETAQRAAYGLPPLIPTVAPTKWPLRRTIGVSIIGILVATIFIIGMLPTGR